MNALNDIKLQAGVIVSELAATQVVSMKSKYDKYKSWLEVDMGVVSYGNFNPYASMVKYIYMTQYKKWDGEKYVAPTTYDANEANTILNNNKSLGYMFQNLITQARDGWEARYTEEFISGNMVKLERALAKHLTNDMTASNINVRVRSVGAEVNATVDNKAFITFGTLCGGDVQCLHYRYRSSLK